MSFFVVRFVFFRFSTAAYIRIEYGFCRSLVDQQKNNTAIEQAVPRKSWKTDKTKKKQKNSYNNELCSTCTIWSAHPFLHFVAKMDKMRAPLFFISTQIQRSNKNTAEKKREMKTTTRFNKASNGYFSICFSSVQNTFQFAVSWKIQVSPYSSFFSCRILCQFFFFSKISSCFHFCVRRAKRRKTRILFSLFLCACYFLAIFLKRKPSKEKEKETTLLRRRDTAYIQKGQTGIQGNCEMARLEKPRNERSMNVSRWLRLRTDALL